MGKKGGALDPAFETHEAYYKEAAELADVLLVENVPEYGVEHTKRALGPDFTIKSVTLDPRVLGLPAARARIFIIAYRHAKITWKEGITMENVLGALTHQVVADASMYIWDKVQPAKLTPGQEPSWTCEFNNLLKLGTGMSPKNMVSPLRVVNFQNIRQSPKHVVSTCRNET